MHVLRHIDREQFQLDFLVHTPEPCAYDNEVRALGGRILPCLGYTRPWNYARNFRRVIAANGPYDIVHSHVHHYNGYTLRLAKQAGVPGRIAHSHIDASVQDMSPSTLRWTYLTTARRWIRRFATLGLAASGKAAEALFGPTWQSGLPCRMLYCGIDLAPFQTEKDSSIREGLQLPPDAFVIGHVGRFDEQKNHIFLLDIFRKVADANPRARLLLIGDGPLRPSIERRATVLGLTQHVVFAGLRTDVPRVLLGAVDVFVMPSLYEGLPLAGIEAQAAGLPCVVSDAITRELDVLPQMIRRLPLSTPASVWADSVLAAKALAATIGRGQALKALEHSRFNITSSVAHLQRIYYESRVSLRRDS
jgi:glycosyltransferase involved in cell wall biosynthesis